MIVGSLGRFVFEVKNDTIQTLDKLKVTNKVKYARHERIGGETLLEFIGSEPVELSFSVFLSAYLGVNPYDALTLLEHYAHTGTALRLVLGDRIYGKNPWVIMSITKDYTAFGHDGAVLSVSAALTLASYAGR